MQEGERPSSAQVQRIITIECNNCQFLGHNKKGCQRAPIQPKEEKCPK